MAKKEKKEKTYRTDISAKVQAAQLWEKVEKKELSEDDARTIAEINNVKLD